MKRIHWHDYITVNIYWLGLTTIYQSNGLIIPLLVQDFVGLEHQGTAFGRLRLYTLMVALLIQALAGMLSDRSTLRWGRRRPFILVGTLLNMACMIAIGASPSYWFLFGAVMLSQTASNIAHGAQQALMPDLIPENHRGRFSAVKSIMELLPVMIIAFTVGKLVAAGQLWAGILVAIVVLFLTMTIAMFANEEPLRESAGPPDWQPFGRLIAMTLIFLVVILGLGQIAKGVAKLVDGIGSMSVRFLVMGATGLLTMGIAVVAGVWASVRISVGTAKLRHYGSFPWWVVNRLAFLIGTTNLSSFAVYFLQARLNLKGAAAAGPASRLMMVVGSVILLAALPSGWLADRIGRKRLVSVSGIAAALGTVVLILAPNISFIYAGGCIVGAAAGTFFTTNWALGTDVVPKQESGRFLGIANLAGAGAGAVGAYIGGPIADYFSTHMPQSPQGGYVLIFAIYAALFLLSSIVLTQVKAVPAANPQ